MSLDEPTARMVPHHALVGALVLSDEEVEAVRQYKRLNPLRPHTSPNVRKFWIDEMVGKVFPTFRQRYSITARLSELKPIAEIAPTFDAVVRARIKLLVLQVIVNL